MQQQDVGWDLVLVGRWGWLSEEYERLVTAKGLTGRVHFPGYLPDGAVAALMQAALFFVFPSLFEGFGLPVLEAQTTGVAVMCANNSALPEIAGDAALLVDPLDVDAIAAAMLRLSRDEALRQELIAKGYEERQAFFVGEGGQGDAGGAGRGREQRMRSVQETGAGGGADSGCARRLCRFPASPRPHQRLDCAIESAERGESGEA